MVKRFAVTLQVVTEEISGIEEKEEIVTALTADLVARGIILESILIEEVTG
jgi:hypothetical protein